MVQAEGLPAVRAVDRGVAHRGIAVLGDGAEAVPGRAAAREPCRGTQMRIARSTTRMLQFIVQEPDDREGGSRGATAPIGVRDQIAQAWTSS
ncbi:MAG: hypothetical protein KF817_05140 [Phycisphaeraceae bacterium]|nr:hypothetical protein [Phycisphaeraceae bacterium]